MTLFDRARQLRRPDLCSQRESLLRQAADQFHTTLQTDSENVTAHYGLAQIYGELGDRKNARKHREAHDRYRPDDNARERAVRLARQRYPAANHAAEALVIYPLKQLDTSGSVRVQKRIVKLTEPE